LFAAGVVDTGGNLPLASLTPVANFAAGIVDTGGKFATGFNNASEMVEKFAAGVVDTGGNFAACVVDVANLLPVSLIPVVHLDLRISPQIFEKNRNGLKLIHEKNQRQKIS
jgi:hypothetical protein